MRKEKYFTMPFINLRKIWFLFFVILMTVTACEYPQVTHLSTLPFDTATPSRMPRPTFTPHITRTPFTTPEKTNYDIPSWLKSPGEHVLMLTLVDVLDSSNWSGVFNKVIFVDVETGEQYPIEIANFVNAYWQDSSTIIFVHGIYCAQAKYISVLDLRTGKLARNKVDGSGYDFCPPLMPKFDVGVSLWDLEPSPVYIYNTRQETYENFWGQTDGWLNASAELSSDNRTLVVLQYKPQSNVDGRFLVYDFLTREVKGTYEVKNTRRYFLISDDNASVVFLEGNTPCVLNLENLSRKCGIPLSDEYKGIFPVGLSRDNSKLFFLHRVEEGSAFVGGLCIKEIYSYSSKAICPMSKLNYLRSISWDEFYVSSYKFSPDEKYIIFNYGGGCPQCDFNGVEGTAIVDLDGNLLFNLKINTDFEWRPTQ